MYIEDYEEFVDKIREEERLKLKSQANFRREYGTPLIDQIKEWHNSIVESDKALNVLFTRELGRYLNQKEILLYNSVISHHPNFSVEMSTSSLFNKNDFCKSKVFMWTFDHCLEYISKADSYEQTDDSRHFNEMIRPWFNQHYKEERK